MLGVWISYARQILRQSTGSIGMKGGPADIGTRIQPLFKTVRQIGKVSRSGALQKNRMTSKQENASSILGCCLSS